MVNFVLINDVYFKVYDYSDGINLKENNAYVYEDIIYVYKGRNFSEETNEPGMYWTNDGELVILEYPKGEEITIDDIVSSENISELLTDKFSVFKEEISKPKQKSVTTTKEVDKTINSGKKTATSGRIAKDEILNLEIYEEDDELTKIIKKYINDSSITREYIDNNYDGDAYNIFYGILKRNSMTWSTFKTWCDILDLDYEIKIIER